MNRISKNAEYGNTKLSDLSEKDKKWDTHRAQTLTVESHYRACTEFDVLAKRLYGCSGSLGFAMLIDKSTGEISYKLRDAKFCHVRFCPVCQWRRTVRNTAKFLAKIPALIAENPSDRFLLLTLTIKNPPMDDLRSTITEMGKAWKRMCLLKDFQVVKGWIRSTEVTHGNDGNPHPHFHILLQVPSYYFKGKYYVTRDRWLAMWRDCTRDQTITQVDVRRLKVGKNGSIEKSVQEVLKYSVKPSDLADDPEFLYGVTRQLHKMRFFASGGTLKDLLKDGKITDKEMIAGDEPELRPDDVEEAEELVYFGFVRAKKAYHRSKD